MRKKAYIIAIIVNLFEDLNQYLSNGRNAYLYSISSALSSADFVVGGSKSVNDIVDSLKNRIFESNNAE